MIGQAGKLAHLRLAEQVGPASRALKPAAKSLAKISSRPFEAGGVYISLFEGFRTSAI
jgi:hypothetical protein